MRNHIASAQVVLEVLLVLGEVDGGCLVQDPVSHLLSLFLTGALLALKRALLLHDRVASLAERIESRRGFKIS